MSLNHGKLGFGMALALVVGNMIGTGIFLLPASLAPYGINSLPAWLLTAGGAILLASVFARLSRAHPQGGGPYTYTRAAFGPAAAFLVSWSYWVALWTGNAAIATGSASYLSPLFPALGDDPRLAAGVTLVILWLLTWVNVRGVRFSGWFQGLSTVLKLVPVLGIAILGLFRADPAWLRQHGEVSLSFGGITASATLTLWAFLGLESATIPDGKVRDPERTIPLATLWGTVLTAVVYLVACGAVFLLLPSGELAASKAPFADVARRAWGETGARLVALFAAISGFGALNGWVMLHGEMPFTLAREGVFPKPFAKASSRGTPAAALIGTSLLVSVLILLNASQATVKVFTFMALLSTSASLYMYLACCAALLRLMAMGRLGSAGKGTPWLAVAGILGGIYALWAIAGAGRGPALWGLLLLATGLPVYAALRRAGQPDSGSG